MILRDGVPWWVLNDVCGILEMANPRQAATRLHDWQKDIVSADTVGGLQELVVVNEAGIYKLVLTSRKPVAEQFERWLTCEVLPSIRKYGMYPPPPPPVGAIANDWTDGTARTLGERFREERLRWEDISGHGFEHVPGFSPSVIRAIEQGNGGLRKRDRIEMVALAGMDLLYILTGRRTVSPQERRVIDYIRQSGDPRALAMLAVATHVAERTCRHLK